MASPTGIFRIEPKDSPLFPHRPALAIYDDIIGQEVTEFDRGFKFGRFITNVDRHTKDIENAIFFGEPPMTKKPSKKAIAAAKKLRGQYRKAYPEISAAWNECSAAITVDLTKFPRSRLQWVKQKETVYSNAFGAGIRQGQSEEAQSQEKQAQRAEQQARIAGLTALTDLAKANSKMAYMLMMALNGGKPFGG